MTPRDFCQWQIDSSELRKARFGYTDVEGAVGRDAGGWEYLLPRE